MTNENDTIDEVYYICVAIRRITPTDDVGEATKYFEQRCEDEETAKAMFDLMKRAVVRSGGEDNLPPPDIVQ